MNLRHVRHNFASQFHLLLHVLDRHLHSRIQFQLERRRVRLAIRRQPHLIRARRHDRPTVAEFRARLSRQRSRSLRTQIPGKAIHAHIGRNLLVGRRLIGPLRRGFRFLFLFVGIAPHNFSRRIQKFERHHAFRRSRKIVINERAVRRVLANRLPSLEKIGPAHAIGQSRLVKHSFRCRLRSCAAQRRDVVQNPERASMRCHHEIVILHDQVMDRTVRQIQLQRLPVRSAIERNINPSLRPRIQQILPHRIFADDMRVSAIRDATRNFRPRLAEIRGFEKIRLQIVQLVRIDCGIRRARIVRRSINQAHQAPFRNSLWRHIRPVLAAIARNVDQAIIGSRPQQVLLHWRLRDREHRVVILDRSIVLGQRSAGGHLFALIVTRQIGTDHRPALAFIGSLEDALGSGVDHIGIMR